MQNDVSDPLSIALLRLRELVASGKLNQLGIEKITGVHQSQVSRILSGKIKRLSKNVKLLCEFEQNLHKTMPIKRKLDQRILSAVDEIWDGTEVQAEALSRLILSLKGFLINHQRGER